MIFAARHGQVLKALEGSQWDDASVDELLAAADESAMASCRWRTAGFDWNERSG